MSGHIRDSLINWSSEVRVLAIGSLISASQLVNRLNIRSSAPGFKMWSKSLRNARNRCSISSRYCACLTVSFCHTKSKRAISSSARLMAFEASLERLSLGAPRWSSTDAITHASIAGRQIAATNQAARSISFFLSRSFRHPGSSPTQRATAAAENVAHALQSTCHSFMAAYPIRIVSSVYEVRA